MPIPQEKKICGMRRRARPSYFCKRSTLPRNLSSRRATLADCCGVGQTRTTGTPGKRTGSNPSPKRALCVTRRDRRAWNNNNSAIEPGWRNCENGELTQKTCN
ncbi:hypothetical protein QUB70_26890 [Microcoleus sp. A003_D6]